jgi:hypothetical protein
MRVEGVSTTSANIRVFATTNGEVCNFDLEVRGQPVP